MNKTSSKIQEIGNKFRIKDTSKYFSLGIFKKNAMPNNITHNDIVRQIDKYYKWK